MLDFRHISAMIAVRHISAWYIDAFLEQGQGCTIKLSFHNRPCRSDLGLESKRKEIIIAVAEYRYHEALKESDVQIAFGGCFWEDSGRQLLWISSHDYTFSTSKL